MIHADLLKLLLPPVAVDPAAAAIAPELDAEGAALDAAALSGDALQNEADPRTAADMLSDWERVCGLPDPCTVAAGVTQTLSQRRAAVVARLTTLGGQSAAYYRAVAAAIGFDIAVEEYSPHDVLHDVEAPLYGPDWQFAWMVQAANDTVIEFTVEDGADDPLATWGNAPLECVIRRLKPAHTAVLFGYDDYYVFPAGYWLGEYAAA